jgi:hypothetical protein
MEIKIVCPFGNECQTAENNSIIRCAWYVKLAGSCPQTKDKYDEWRCAMAWQPILAVEVASTNRGQTAALESFRNEVVKRQDVSLNPLLIGSR